MLRGSLLTHSFQIIVAESVLMINPVSTYSSRFIVTRKVITFNFGVVLEVSNEMLIMSTLLFAIVSTRLPTKGPKNRRGSMLNRVETHHSIFTGRYRPPTTRPGAKGKEDASKTEGSGNRDPGHTGHEGSGRTERPEYVYCVWYRMKRRPGGAIGGTIWTATALSHLPQ